MAYRELELRLLSAQELKDVNLMTRMHVYAVVSISGDLLTRQCTAPDPYGGRNPCWNTTFRFAVPPTANGACLHVLLRAERLLGDRDVGEVVVPLADILAGATGAGPQPPQLASYQVRKVHRWEPRGVLNVSYRLGPIVAPVADWVPDKAADFNNGYAPAVGVPQQASHQHPSAAAADEAAQNKSPVMAYPVGVPQQASHPPAKPDAYQPPTPPRPRTAAVHEAPAPPPRNGHGQPSPTHVYMAPQTQIIFGGAPTATTAAGLPSRATSPARSIISPAGKTGDGNWSLLHDTHGNSNYASAAESVSVISPRSRREEDRWRPSVLSQSHHDTEQQARSSPAARLGGAAAASSASPLSSRSSSFSSSPLPPYTAASPRPPAAVSGDAEVTHGTFRSTPSVSPYSSSTLAPVIPKPAISSPSLSTHP